MIPESARGLCGVILFCCTGPGIIFLNKHILSTLKFRYPMTLCLTQDLFALVISFTSVQFGFVKLQHQHIVTPRFYVTRILPVGLCLTTSLVLGNYAYLSLSVAFIQMCKAFTPVVLLLMCFIARLEDPNWYLIASILLMSCGTWLSCQGEVQFAWVGFYAIMASCVAESCKVVGQQILLTELRFGVIEGLYYMAPAVCFWMTIGILRLELHDLINDGAFAIMTENPGTFLSTGVLAFGVNFSTLFVIKYCSGLTLKVVACGRNMGVVFISSYIWNEVVQQQQVHGYIISSLGFLLYNYSKLTNSNKKDVDDDSSSTSLMACPCFRAGKKSGTTHSPRLQSPSKGTSDMA